MRTGVVILGGARTAPGVFGGGLAGAPASPALAAHLAEAAPARSDAEGAQVGQVFFGHVVSTEPRDPYLSGATTIGMGMPDPPP